MAKCPFCSNTTETEEQMKRHIDIKHLWPKRDRERRKGSLFASITERGEDDGA